MFQLIPIFFLVLNIGSFKYTEAICDQCNSNNGIACISETEFLMCFNGVPDTTKTYSCLNANEICTTRAAICMDSTLTTGIVPGCGDTSICGKCETLTDGAWTCTSRTTFTMCLDNQLTEIRYTCPDSYMCDVDIAATGVNPCVPECMEPTITYCDLKEAIDAPITTTQAPTTTTEIPSTTTTEEPTTITTTTEEIPTTTTSTTEEATTTTTVFNPTPTTIATTTDVPTTTTIEEDTTTTTMSPTVISTTTTEITTTQSPADIVCSQQTAVGRYAYPNDTTCRQYIYCFMKGGTMQSLVLECPAELYFNTTTSLCGEDKPEGCV